MASSQQHFEEASRNNALWLQSIQEMDRLIDAQHPTIPLNRIMANHMHGHVAAFGFL